MRDGAIANGSEIRESQAVQEVAETPRETLGEAHPCAWPLVFSSALSAWLPTPCVPYGTCIDSRANCAF